LADGAVDGSVFDSLLDSEGVSFFFEDLPADALLAPFESVMYQPDPLNWTVGGWSTLWMLLRRQFGQRSIGGSLNF
jgi:hypothetical protein